MTKSKLDFKALLQRVASLFTHNWQWKLISVLLAVALWSGLITQDDTLTRSKTFEDVTINVLNADTLRHNGFIVVDGLQDLPTVTIEADVPQKNYNAAAASNYNLRVDLSRIRSAGEQTLNLLTTTTTSYGSVSEMSVSSITVRVEEYISRSRIPVRLSISGDLEENFFAGSASVDPVYVTVSGPKSEVERVVRCVADYDMSILSAQTGVERTAVPFRLVAADGSDIDRSLIEVTSESVILDSFIVEQPIYAAKELVINTTDLVSGHVPEGYVIKRITAEPATLTIAGSNELIESLNELHLVEMTAQQIDVTNASDTLMRRISLVPPSGAVYLSSDTVMVTVEIASK